MAVRVGIVGAGRRGGDWVAAVRSSPECVLAGLVDVDPQALASLGDRMSIMETARFPTLEALRARGRPDAVIVATPMSGHRDVCLEAIEAGLAVLVEKPFAASVSDARAMVNAADRRGVPLLVGQSYRYLRVHRAVKQLLDAHAIGAVASVSARYFRAAHDVTAGLRAQVYAALWETGVHHLDAMRHALGRNVTGVAADLFTLPWSELRGTGGHVLLRFEGGIHGTYSVTWDARGHEWFERGQEFYARYTGERGSLHVWHRWIALCARGHWPRLVRRGPRRATEEVQLLSELARAIAHGDPVRTSGRDNLQTVATLEAVVLSAERGTWIDPQSLLGEDALPPSSAPPGSAAEGP